jgi:hypothetical protein
MACRWWSLTVLAHEFVMVAGTWRLMATSNTLDQPWLFTLAGNPDRPSSWLEWTPGQQLQVPSQAFNSGTGISSVSYEHASSAFLCSAGSLPGGYTYLLYASSNELTQFDGWGHAGIGIARSSDLVHWRVPPG